MISSEEAGGSPSASKFLACSHHKVRMARLPLNKSVHHQYICIYIRFFRSCKFYAKCYTLHLLSEHASLVLDLSLTEWYLLTT